MLAEKPLHEATKNLNVDIQWMPFELRPYPTPTLRPEDPYLPTAWERGVYPMAERLGVDITLPTVSPQPYTRLAFEGFQYAANRNTGTLYTSRVMRAFFRENRDIGRIEVLRDIAEELGLNGADFAAALEQGRYKQAHQDALREAEAHVVTVVPTLIIDGHTRIEGVPTPAHIRKAILDAAATASR
jgi:predicted DsbA family dithiol-disulfide isomerase